MNCPKCGSLCQREFLDVGVGVMPTSRMFCPACHWIEPTAEGAPRSQGQACDHKFVDSQVCVKCGWSPTRRPGRSRLEGRPLNDDGQIDLHVKPNNAARLLTELAMLPDEALGWLALACAPAATMHGAHGAIWPVALDRFSKESRHAIEAARAAALVYIDELKAAEERPANP